MIRKIFVVVFYAVSAGMVISAPGLSPFNVPLQPQMLTGELHAGQVMVRPDSGTVGEYGTWEVIYRVGTNRIKTGGGVRVQLPEVWHAGLRNSAFPLQATRPALDNYVCAHCSNPEVQLQTTVELESEEVLVKTVKPSNMSRRMGYYVFVVRVVVLEGHMSEGDTLSVIYGDRSKGSRGMRAGVVSGNSEPVLIAVDCEGHGKFRLHADRPQLRLQSALPVEMLLTARSEAVVGEQTNLRVALLDSFGNPASDFVGKVKLMGPANLAEIPAAVTFDSGKGWQTVRFKPIGEGLLRFEAIEPARQIQARSNPIIIAKQSPAQKLYWGDLHSHTRYSVADAVGLGEDAYEYGRHVSGLDFYAMTDHSQPASAVARGLSTDDWQGYTALAERFYAPGEFVTFHAYEASFYAPYGHHNVYFRGKPGPLLNPETVTLPELWRALTVGQALTIPHHTLKMPEPIDWKEADHPEFRRNFEIYSGHGSSESYEPTHPLAFEQSLFTNPSRSTTTGMSAQRAWIEGFALSTMASSDDHRAHPGQPHYGLVAVRSRSLTRESIFDALRERKTYATTGARIILDFFINGAEMGRKIKTQGPVSIEVRAMGTDLIDLVEVLRHVKGQLGFEIIQRRLPAAEEVSFRFDDSPGKTEAIYYVRLRQRQLVRERMAMAWSSPIWVTVE